jgi:hypothetical protein
MGRSARIDLWGKGHRVTRETEEFQRLVPARRAEPASALETFVDHFDRWPELLDSLYKSVPKALPEQYCLRIVEQEALVATPHAVRDAHDRDSVLLVLAYVDIDWKDHRELVRRISGARGVSVKLGAEVSSDLSGANTSVSERLRTGTFLASRDYPLEGAVPEDPEWWRDMLAEVARFHRVHGVSTPRMKAMGANVIVGTRAEAERAAADGYFDRRTRRLLAFGERLVTWASSPSEAEPATRPPAEGDVATHLLEVRDGLEKVEATVDRLSRGLDAAAKLRADEVRKADEIRKAVETVNRRHESVERRVEEMHQDTKRSFSLIQAGVDLTVGMLRFLSKILGAPDP